MDVGGAINLGTKLLQRKIHSVGDGLAAYGIGAAAGAIGYATGGAALAAAGGAAGGAGGFLAGFAGGAIGSAYSMPIQSIGNTLYFGDPMMTNKQFAVGVIGGGLLGGSIQGISALANGRTFWDGSLKVTGPGKTYIPSLKFDEPDFEVKPKPFNKSYSDPSELQVPNKLYHYTYDEPYGWSELSKGKTLYLTPDGELNRLSATFDLDLPRVPRYRIEITTTDPNFNLSNIQLARRVNGNFFGHGGGGYEILYNGSYRPSEMYDIIITTIW
ncbi:MAG: hypothetical protein ABFS32_21020 [Bacteroidota bacterium]